MTDFDQEIERLAEAEPTAYRDKPVLVVAYYLGGYSINEIADTFDVSYSAIHRYMEIYNLPRRSSGRPSEGDE